jgi:predicted ATPase
MDLFNEIIGSQAKTNKKTPIMLPLSITGLYSYQKKQTIDFEELTNAVYRYFGAVGSGKSSVLKPLVLFYTVIQAFK